MWHMTYLNLYKIFYVGSKQISISKRPGYVAFNSISFPPNQLGEKNNGTYCENPKQSMVPTYKPTHKKKKKKIQISR